MRIFVFLTCLFIGLGLTSQAQGIAGRRLTAEVEFDYAMRYFSPTEKLFSIGGKFRVGYVVATRLQLCAGVNYYKLNYKQDVLDTAYANAYNVLGEATDNIKCTEFDLTGRYFLRKFGKRMYDCIAPDGKYFEFSLISTRTQYDPGALPYLWDEPLLEEVRSIRVSVGLGNQQVWWNRVIANTGILVSFPVKKITSYDEDNAPYMLWQNGHNYFRGYFSIGVLL